MKAATTIAYACVAYRMMEYEKFERTEENYSVMLETLIDFCTPAEIQKIYDHDASPSIDDFILKSSEYT